MSLRLHEDGMRRSNTFRLGSAEPNARRRWGQIDISVTGKIIK